MTLNLVNSSPYIIPILRGITPENVLSFSEILITAGLQCIEIPLNSPAPYESILRVRERVGEKFDVGAGTVLTVKQVFEVKQAGANLVLTPNCNADIIEACHACGLKCIPGFSTVTEAFTAIEAGARQLKLFPANHFGIDYLKSLLAVLPDHVQVIPVGGVDADNLNQWLEAGAGGAGVGNWLYTRILNSTHLQTEFRP